MNYYIFFGELYDGVMVEEVVSNDDFYGACQRWSAVCGLVYWDYMELEDNVAHVNGAIETPRMVIEAAPRRTGRTFRSWLCNYFK